MNLLSAYLWGYSDFRAGEKSISTFRNFYSDSDVFIKVDHGGDLENYKKSTKKHKVNISQNPFNVGKCGDWDGVYTLGRECWPLKNTLLWLDGIYQSCKQTNSKYMVILEEDVFLMKPISIIEKDFGIAIVKNKNVFPNRITKFISDLNGNILTKGYGGCGGAIINTNDFIKGYETAYEALQKEYEDIKLHSKLIGWSDMILQVIVMVGGGSVVINEQLVEPWMEEQGWIADSWRNYEMVNYLKDYTLL